MICPSCKHDFLCLFICHDEVYRCYSCQRAQPVPIQATKGPTNSRFVKDLRRARGLCPRCGEPSDGKVYCARHREEYRLACIERRKKERVA